MAPATDGEEQLWTSSTRLSFNPSRNPLACTVDPAGRSLGLCVRRMSAGVRGLDLELRRRAMQGVCSLVMFVPAPQDVTTPPQVGLSVKWCQNYLLSLRVDIHAEYVEQRAGSVR